MNILLAVIAVVLMFMVVVGLHELGHAVVARCFGVRIRRIAIGFGKPLYIRKDKSGVEWVLGIWPLGGYVFLSNTRIQPEPATQFPHCFDKQSVSTRCWIVLAGVAVNLLVAWLAMTVVFSVGYRQLTPLVASVIPGTVAEEAGLRPGDELIRINNRSIHSWQEAGMQLLLALGDTKVSVQVRDKHHQVRKQVMVWGDNAFLKRQGAFLERLGVIPKKQPSAVKWVPAEGVMEALRHALRVTSALCCDYLLLIKQVITGLLPFSLLLGPLGLLSLSIGSFLQGLSAFMSFLALLSIAVGVVNILPIPGLDGGALLYLALEKIRGKPLSIAMEVLLYRLAMIVFCLVMVQLMLNDGLHYLFGLMRTT